MQCRQILDVFRYFIFLFYLQAFEWIIKNNLLSREEEEELINSISFGKFGPKFEDFSRLLFKNQVLKVIIGIKE